MRNAIWDKPWSPYQTPALKQDSSPPGEWCKALHSFTAETSEDLPFKRGDRILILERLDSDWYRGRLHDREGIFPAVFVQPCPGTTATSVTYFTGPRLCLTYISYLHLEEMINKVTPILLCPGYREGEDEARIKLFFLSICFRNN